MQFAKDSFSIALRQRLAALNPARTVTVSGAQRPAVVVLENELPAPAEQLPQCFYLEWGQLQPVNAASVGRAMYQWECTISYFTEGTAQSGVDRGRTLGELDRELYLICQPPFTEKQDFRQAPSVDLGTGVIWTAPIMTEPKVAADGATSGTARLERTAQVSVFFFPEVDFL
jgi:hypothetical protein